MENIKIYAFSDEACPNLDGQIVALKRNGLNGVEMRGVDGENVSALSVEKAREIRKKLDDNDLIVWSIGSPIGKINIKDDFEAHLDLFRKSLETSAILGAKCYRLFSFYMPKGEDVSPYKNEVIEKMGRMVDAARGYDIEICHENEKGIYGDVPERCLEIHKALPTVRGVFDPANYVQCGVDTLKGWELLKDYIYYMHIKDAMADGFVVPAGKGIGNVAAIVKDYIARGGNSFTIEPTLAVFDGLSGLEREGESTKALYTYATNGEAFDAACNAFKALL